MTDLFRFIATLFGRRYVALRDFDGDMTVRHIVWEGGQAVAWRWPYIRSGRSVLLDNGSVSEPTKIVVGWEPYNPLAPRKWPKWEPAE